MKNFSWKSKGQTLLWLENKLSYSSVPRLMVFTFKEWVKNSNKILNKIQHKFPNKNIAIRSSSLSEDSLHSSYAGAFMSYLDINVKNLKLISNSIDLVFSSSGKSPLQNDELIGAVYLLSSLGHLAQSSGRLQHQEKPFLLSES